MKARFLVSLGLIAFSQVGFAAGFYGVGQVTRSQASLEKNYFNGQLAGAGATGLSSSTDGSGYQWRLQGGYRFNQYLAVEAGYIDFGQADYKASYAGGSARGKLKAGGADLVALASLPVNQDFSVFGKAGLVFAHVQSSLAAGAPAGLASDSSNSNVVRPLLGIGANYKLTEHLDLRADFDHVSGLGDSHKTGKMDSNMVSLGFAYGF